MPIPPSYPGVYIEEIPSGVRTIIGVPTSITAFIGRAAKGPQDEPVLINGFGEYERLFGGLVKDSTMSYAVSDFYGNGGSQALIVRIAASDAEYARIHLGDLVLRAASRGAWGNNLRATVNWKTRDPLLTDLFNLIVEEVVKEHGEDRIVTTETYLNVSADDNDPRFLTKVLENASNLVRVDTWATPHTRPHETFASIPSLPSMPSIPSTGPAPAPVPADGLGFDGGNLGPNDYVGGTHEGDKTGLFALAKADLFNLLCIPPPVRGGSTDATIYARAAGYCRARRAVLLVDPPTDWDDNETTAVGKAIAGKDNLGPAGLDQRNAALYFPQLVEADPLSDNQFDSFVPCGAVAGIIATTDANRGIFKSPAGIEAGISGIAGLTVRLTDPENGLLNPLGINCLRQFPVIGRVVWGARTMRGADLLTDEYKYLAVRRMALYIEESLYRGTQFVVFEPNDEPLWAQIRLAVGSFMHQLFRQGAFQGSSPRDAYLVKCDKETTTQADINAGVVNILVGFAPLKPAEFVFIKIQQLAGQIAV